MPFRFPNITLNFDSTIHPALKMAGLKIVGKIYVIDAVRRLLLYELLGNSLKFVKWNKGNVGGIFFLLLHEKSFGEKNVCRL